MYICTCTASLTGVGFDLNILKCFWIPVFHIDIISIDFHF